jgi:hypothetical protein
MIKREARIPEMIKPELKIGATLATPRSLMALSVQLNHGERAIEMPIDISAHAGAIIPNHAATLGLIIFLQSNIIEYTLLYVPIYSSY